MNEADFFARSVYFLKPEKITFKAESFSGLDTKRLPYLSSKEFDFFERRVNADDLRFCCLQLPLIGLFRT